MKQRGNLLGVIGSGLATLALCSLALGYLTSYFDGRFQPLNAFGLSTSGVLMAFWSFAFGLPVVALYGVPIYLVLAKRAKATWANVLVAASLPCLLLGLWSWQSGLLLVGFALSVAAVIRVVHGAGPNNSFKPKPLRGSA